MDIRGLGLTPACHPATAMEGVGRCTLASNRQRQDMHNNVVKISSSRQGGTRHLFRNIPTDPPLGK
jgi:hypothetical protein